MATTADRRGRRSAGWLTFRNLPNILTLSRLVFTAGFIWAMSLDSATGAALALALFVIAAITDGLDGWLARKYKLSTPFGMFMDPLADKILVLSALLVFLWQNLAPVWMVLMILSRELIITSVRILAESRGQTLPAMSEGKQKMLSQTIAIIGTLAVQCGRFAIQRATGQPYDTWLIRRGPGGEALARAMDLAPEVLLFVATFLSVYSGIVFLLRHRRLFVS